MSEPKRIVPDRALRIYVASPYTIGRIGENMKAHMDAAQTLMDRGYAPYAPLLMHFLDMCHPRSYEARLGMDLEWLPTCDAILRLPGESKGADKECELAGRLGIPVFHNITALEMWAQSRR